MSDKPPTKLFLWRPMDRAQSRFYDSYDPEFLFRKAEILHAIYRNRDSYDCFVTSIGWTKDGTGELEYFTALATEIYCSTFQQFESLFALLIAIFQRLPHWVYLTRYTTKEITEKIEALADGRIADLTNGMCSTEAEFISNAVYSGITRSNEPDFTRSLEDLEIGKLTRSIRDSERERDRENVQNRPRRNPNHKASQPI